MMICPSLSNCTSFLWIWGLGVVLNTFQACICRCDDDGISYETSTFSIFRPLRFNTAFNASSRIYDNPALNVFEPFQTRRAEMTVTVGRPNNPTKLLSLNEKEPKAVLLERTVSNTCWHLDTNASARAKNGLRFTCAYSQLVLMQRGSVIILTFSNALHGQ